MDNIYSPIPFASKTVKYESNETRFNCRAVDCLIKIYIHCEAAGFHSGQAAVSYTK